MLCPCPFYTGFSGREHSAWIRRKASDRHAGSVFKRIKSCDAKSCGCQIFCDKESGKSGGFLEKVQAAEEAKAVLVVVGRPFEVGKILKETKKFLEIWAGLC